MGPCKEAQKLEAMYDGGTPMMATRSPMLQEVLYITKQTTRAESIEMCLGHITETNIIQNHTPYFKHLARSKTNHRITERIET